MHALEARQQIARAKAKWKAAFAAGATKLHALGTVAYWHEQLGIWGCFGESIRTDGTSRDWNAFGQVPARFRNNIIVEVNPPRAGQDLNLQGVFATDEQGNRWILHQGRMSIRGARVTEDDFGRFSGAKPVNVSFKSGRVEPYFRVTMIDAPEVVIQQEIAAFVATCAKVRLAKAAPRLARAIDNAQAWEHKLSPEVTGQYDLAARNPAVVQRRHADVWHALKDHLERRGEKVANTRVASLGPDLFTIESNVLFEIKSGASAQDVFSAIGQLLIYEKLLGEKFRKVLVVPEGMRHAIANVLPGMGFAVVEYTRAGRRVKFDAASLGACFK